MSDERGRPVLLPGVLHAFLFTAFAFLVAHFTDRIGIGATALGVLFGVVAGNVRPLGPILKPGVSFVGKRVLALAVVLLGLQVTLRELAGIGGVAALAVGTAVVGALLVAWGAGRLLKVPGALTALIGTGTAICGVSAIAAVRPAVGAKDEEVTYAVAAITFLGSVGLLVYPALQWLFHPLDGQEYGVLAGATLHSVPQAVGAAFAGGGIAAGGLATITKLARVALLGPVVLLLGALSHRAREGAPGWRLPVEVWGFLLLFALNSVVVLPQGLRSVVADVDHVLLVWALTALGLQTRFTDLRRAGVAPLLVALVAWVAVVALVLLVLATA